MNAKHLKIFSVIIALSVWAGVSVVQAASPKSSSKTATARRSRAKLTEAQIDMKLARLTDLCQKNLRAEVVSEFKDEDIAAWLSVFKDKNTATSKALTALNMRGTSLAQKGHYDLAEKDFIFALKLSPSNGYYWNSLAGIYKRTKRENEAIDAYKKAVEFDSAQHKTKSFGWMPISSTLEAASILTHRTDYPEALKVLEYYNDEDIQKMSPYWARRMLRSYGQIYAALGREEEAAAKFKTALEFEEKK